MYQNIISQEIHQQEQQQHHQSSPTSEQMSSSPTLGQRRPSLWERMAIGAVHASKADMHNFHESAPEGFAPAGAKFDETFGNSALFETGFELPHRDQEKVRERVELSEDALRQMS